MRQALGLRSDAPVQPSSDRPVTQASGSHPQRRRFVRDGDVPVTLIHRDRHVAGEPGTNQLDVARHAIRAEAAARELAERSLNEARITIRDLQTKVAHERLAKDEALEIVRRLETEARAAVQALQNAEAELAATRLARQNGEDALAEALEARQETGRKAPSDDRRPAGSDAAHRAIRWSWTAKGDRHQTQDAGRAGHRSGAAREDWRIADDRGRRVKAEADSSAWTARQGQEPGIRICRVVEAGLAR